MSDPEIAIEDNRSNLFEGSMTYKIKGTDTNLTMIEALSPARYYPASISDDLNGEWTPLKGAESWEKPFAGIRNVTFANGASPWSRDISYGPSQRGYDDEPPASIPIARDSRSKGARWTAGGATNRCRIPWDS